MKLPESPNWKIVGATAALAGLGVGGIFGAAISSSDDDGPVDRITLDDRISLRSTASTASVPEPDITTTVPTTVPTTLAPLPPPPPPPSAPAPAPQRVAPAPAPRPAPAPAPRVVSFDSPASYSAPSYSVDSPDSVDSP